MIWKTLIPGRPDILRDPYSAHISALEAVDSPRKKAGLVFHSGLNILTCKYQITLYTPNKVNDLSKPFHPKAPCDFMIRLNPVVTRNHKRVPLMDPIEIREWVERKLEPFNAVILHISPPHRVAFRKKWCDTVTIHTVMASGRVYELPENFEKLLLKGVGREKAFGYGTFHIYER